MKVNIFSGTSEPYVGYSQVRRNYMTSFISFARLHHKTISCFFAWINSSVLLYTVSIIKYNKNTLFANFRPRGLYRAKFMQFSFCSIKATRPKICKKSLLSPRNALRWGYSNAAVVPCVRACVVPSVRG